MATRSLVEPYWGKTTSISSPTDQPLSSARPSKTAMVSGSARSAKVPNDLVVNAVIDRGPQRGVEGEEERDDRNADQQCRRGGRRALGVAGRVLAGELADHALHSRQWRTDELHRRLREHGADQHRGGEDEQHSQAHRQDAAVAGHTAGERQGPENGDTDGDDEADPHPGRALDGDYLSLFVQS